MVRPELFLLQLDDHAPDGLVERIEGRQEVDVGVLVREAGPVGRLGEVGCRVDPLNALIHHSQE